MSSNGRRVTFVECHPRHSASVRSFLGQSGYVVGHSNGYLIVAFDKGETVAIKKKWLQEVEP